jgi:LuxR family transcriptional regulator, quorum-sensing system regulator CviR
MSLVHTLNTRPLPQGLPAARQWTLLEWLHQIGHIEDEAGLKAFLESLKHQVPSEHMVLALGRLNPNQHLQKLEKLINVNYPLGWVEHYMQSNFASCDPILHTPMGKDPIFWRETFSVAKSPLAKRFIAEAASFGLGNGVSFSAASSRQNMASLISFTGEEVTRDTQLVEMLNCLVPHLYHAMMRVTNLAPMSPSAMLLSNREYDIFHWMSRGKTNWEIATILEISERTVKFHVANIIRKLNANNRTHAIVLGLQQGLKPPIAANE